MPIRPVLPDPQEKRHARRIAAGLAGAYPENISALHFADPWECLAATILSAQCTDKKVNECTPALFAAWRGPKAMARAAPREIEPYIRSIGLYRAKARYLVASAQAVMARFGGVVPERLEDIASLPGAGRKTANCVLANAYGQPAIMVDTHCIRVTRRLGLHQLAAPDRIEGRLKALLPRRQWTPFSRRIIRHGRECCAARKPRCGACPLAGDCREWGA